MPRTSYRPVAAVGLVVALLAYVGCSSSRDGTGETAGAAGKPSRGSSPSSPVVVPEAKPKAEAEAVAPPLADWPAPAGALVLSGEQLGYLEPCGCSAGQLGGLLRRYRLIEQLKAERKWPLALADLGSLIKDPASARGGPEQTKIKFHTALQALAAMKYDALALSPEDLKVGVDEAVGQFLNLPGESPKVVAANVAAAGLESKVVPSVRAKAGAVTFGLTAVVDPEAINALRDPSRDLLTVKPVDESLPGVLADLERDTQVQVLLAHFPLARARDLAVKYPGFDVVVALSAAGDPPTEAETVNGGKTLVVTVGQRGKFTGVVGYYPGSEPALRYRLVTLGPKFDGPAAPVKRVIEDEYRDALKSQGVVANFPRHDSIGGGSGTRYVGAEACKSCHPNTFAKWSSTKHARAFESLVNDPKPNTIYDAECVSCHTTGFEYTTGWTSPDQTAFLKGNQCENCHGPASKHAAEPDDKAVRELMHLTADRADKNRLCLRCHDEDNSPHFDFGKYWPQVAHKGLDTYQDPKTHQGTPPKVARHEGGPR